VRAFDGVRIDAPLVEDRRVTGIVVDGEARRAGVVVAADGSSSKLRRSLGLERTARSRRVGIRAHFLRPHGHARLTDVEIFLRHGYELYVTPLPGHEILVAALAHEDAARGDLRAAFRRWLEAEPLLKTWLDGAAQTSELAGRAPLVRRAEGKTPPGLILLGDAHASVDPITAGGMSVALVSAALLARDMRGVLEQSAAARRRFERARGRIVRTHRLLGGCLLALSRHPRLAALACRALELAPGVMGRLVRLVTKGA